MTTVDSLTVAVMLWFQLTDQRLGKLADWVTRNNITVVKLDSTQKVTISLFGKFLHFYLRGDEGGLWGCAPLLHRHLLGRDGLWLPTEGQDQGLQGVHWLHCHAQVITRKQQHLKIVLLCNFSRLRSLWSLCCDDIQHFVLFLFINRLKINTNLKLDIKY